MKSNFYETFQNLVYPLSFSVKLFIHFTFQTQLLPHPLLPVQPLQITPLSSEKGKPSSPP